MDKDHRQPSVTTGTVAALLFVQLLFGAFPVVAKLAFPSFGAGGVSVLRIAGGAIFFQALRLLRREAPVPWREQPKFVLCAALGIASNQLLFLYGLERTSAMHAALLVTTVPIATMAASAILGRERLTTRRLFGMGVAGLGAALLITGRDLGGTATLLGDAMVLANAAVYGIYLVLSRDILIRHGPLTAIAWFFTWGLPMVLPVAGWPAMAGHTREEWLAIAFIVGGPTIATYWLNLVALRRLPASVVALFIYVQPVITAVLAVPFLGERLTLWTLLTGAMSFVGVYVATRQNPVRPGATR